MIEGPPNQLRRMISGSHRMSGDFEKSPPPKDIFVAIEKNPVGDLPLRINAVCSEHPDYVVHSITKVQQRHRAMDTQKSLLLHLRMDDSWRSSEDLQSLMAKVDILVENLEKIKDYLP